MRVRILPSLFWRNKVAEETQEKMISKEEFLEWFNKNYKSWSPDRTRSLAAHLLGVEEFSNMEFNRLTRERNTANKG